MYNITMFGIRARARAILIISYCVNGRAPRPRRPPEAVGPTVAGRPKMRVSSRPSSRADDRDVVVYNAKQKAAASRPAERRSMREGTIFESSDKRNVT